GSEPPESPSLHPAGAGTWLSATPKAITRPSRTRRRIMPGSRLCRYLFLPSRTRWPPARLRRHNQRDSRKITVRPVAVALIVGTDMFPFRSGIPVGDVLVAPVAPCDVRLRYGLEHLFRGRENIGHVNKAGRLFG